MVEPRPYRIRVALDPGDDRSMTREEYERERRIHRLGAHLMPMGDRRRLEAEAADRWYGTLHLLSCSIGATAADLEELQKVALERSRSSAVRAYDILEGLAAAYLRGDRFCSVCGRLAPLRDDECPNCRH